MSWLHEHTVIVVANYTSAAPLLSTSFGTLGDFLTPVAKGQTRHDGRAAQGGKLFMVQILPTARTSKNFNVRKIPTAQTQEVSITLTHVACNSSLTKRHTT